MEVSICLDFSGSTVFNIPCFQFRGLPRVLSLVEELRSHMLQGALKKKKRIKHLFDVVLNCNSVHLNVRSNLVFFLGSDFDRLIFLYCVDQSTSSHKTDFWLYVLRKVMYVMEFSLNIAL